MSTTRHRAISALLYYLAFAATMFGVIMPTALVAIYLPGWWAWVGGVLTFLILGNLAAAGWVWLRRRRADAFYRLFFPFYAGQRTYVGSLLGAAGPGFTRGYGARGDVHAIADGGECLFVIENNRSRTPHATPGGRLFKHPASGAPFPIGKDRITYIGVEELSDAAIKRNAVDPKDAGERMIEAGLMRMVGVKTKRTIVPYAAYIDLRHVDEEGEHQLLFGIPTEISNETMKSFGVDHAAEGNELIDAAVAKAVGAGQDAVFDDLHGRASGLVGDGVVGAFDTVVDLKHDLDMVVSLGAAAKIGSTNGARGRVLARLAAERLRAQSGLAEVRVVRLPD